MSRFANEVLALIGRDLLLARITKQVTVPNPVAGADFIAPVPGGTIWELLSCTASLQTSAVVATRRPSLRTVDADQNILTLIDWNATQAQNVSQRYAWMSGIGAWAAGAQAMLPLPVPPSIVVAGGSVRASTALLDAGDQWSGIQLVVREWDETAIMQEAQELFVGLEQYIESGYREGGDY